MTPESTSPDPTHLALLGVPSSAGARMLGQEEAPRALRRAGLLETLRSPGRVVTDQGDLAPVVYAPDLEHPKYQNLFLVRDVVERVAGAVGAAETARAWPVVLGGDCTVTLGVVSALARRFPDLGLIYFDGDLDLNTPETTSSGILDGMVLAHLLGEGAGELSRSGSRYPLLEESRIALFGYSVSGGGIDPVELDRLATTRMAKHPLESIRGRARATAAQALEDLERRAAHLLVHFDLDVIDFDDFPAVDVPHRPGLGFEEAGAALEVFLASPRAVGLVVTEFNARRDADGRLARRLAGLLGQAVPVGRPETPGAAGPERGGRPRRPADRAGRSRG